MLADHDDWLRPTLLGIVAVGLLCRLLFLGDPLAHWDEARVAYDTFTYTTTGVWEYRPIVHGPFLPRITHFTYAIFGYTEVAIRIGVALTGSLLPAAPYLYRKYLDDVEVVSAALILAIAPPFVYYSQFMRVDIPLITWIVLSFGFLLRFVETRQLQFTYATSLTGAFALTTKENFILYIGLFGVLTILGIVGELLRNHRLNWRNWWEEGKSAWPIKSWRRVAVHGVLNLGVVLSVLVWFYAPRTAGDGPGLDTLAADPTALPAVISTALYGSAEKLVGTWINGGMQDNTYTEYLSDYSDLLVEPEIGLGLICLAGLGLSVHLYRNRLDFRFFPVLAVVGALASFLGYPKATDIISPWLTLHTLIFLVVPASLGIGYLVKAALPQFEERDRSVVFGSIAVLLIVGGLIGPMVAGVYLSPTTGPLVQHGQPGEAAKTPYCLLSSLPDDDDDVDVVYFGDEYYEANVQAEQLPAAGNWYNRLPLPWYTKTAGLETTSETHPSDVLSTNPDAIIAPRDSEQDLEPYTENYEVYEFTNRKNADLTLLYIEQGKHEMVATDCGK